MAVKEFLTVKEFAELVGRSRQAIYKQLDNQLKEFVQVIDNKKMIKSEALKDVFDIDPDKKIEGPDLTIQANLEKTLYEILREELEAKNEQILALQAELAVERKHSREQADKIAVFADQAQKLQLAQMQPQITDEEELAEEAIMPEKKGFFEMVARLFKKSTDQDHMHG